MHQDDLTYSTRIINKRDFNVKLLNPFIPPRTLRKYSARSPASRVKIRIFIRRFTFPPQTTCITLIIFLLHIIMYALLKIYITVANRYTNTVLYNNNRYIFTLRGLCGAALLHGSNPIKSSRLTLTLTGAGSYTFIKHRLPSLVYTHTSYHSYSLLLIVTTTFEITSSHNTSEPYRPVLRFLLIGLAVKRDFSNFLFQYTSAMSSVVPITLSSFFSHTIKFPFASPFINSIPPNPLQIVNL